MARVLVVEDERLVADLVEDALVDEGLEVAVAYSGVEAVNRLEAEARSFAVLVTDINLGNHLDGFAVARQARSLNPGVKVVYVTGKPANLYAAEEDALMFPKPFDVVDLAEQVKLLVGRQG
jgi:DNA-binding response OmpR family regulator